MINEWDEIRVLIRDRRKKLKITLKQLSEETGIGFSYISKIERGEYIPSIETIDRMCHPLGLELKIMVNVAGKKKTKGY
jgi:transcriptional regulator with XRE-family HTH domain